MILNKILNIKSRHAACYINHCHKTYVTNLSGMSGFFVRQNFYVCFVSSLIMSRVFSHFKSVRCYCLDLLINVFLHT